MSDITTYLTRNNNIESTHSIKCLIVNYSGKTIYSTNNDEDVIFPRSAIKIFQAIPFASSGAIKKYSLSKKQIALSCSSHIGEEFHLRELSNWFKKLKIPLQSLKCGIHNPINLASSNKLLLSGSKPNQLHNNCSGKHLGMLSATIMNKLDIKSYLDFTHPVQKDIRRKLEIFSESKIKKNNFSLDGCSAPQYGLKIKDVARALINLNKSIKNKFSYSDIIINLMSAILNNPKYIGGTNNLDSDLISISDKKIFCKGGAEGIFLFVHLKNNIVGVLKVKDGNQRALPSSLIAVLDKLKILPSERVQALKRKQIAKIRNHAGNIIGSIFTELN